LKSKMKCCQSNFGMANSNIKTFLGNVQWKIAKQLRNIDFHNDFHNMNVTTNWFKF